MSGSPENPPAFPPNAGWRDDDAACRGMTLRDWFAGQALSGFLGTEACIEGTNYLRRAGENPEQCVAETAYRIADALLAARGDK